MLICPQKVMDLWEVCCSTPKGSTADTYTKKEIDDKLAEKASESEVESIYNALSSHTTDDVIHVSQEEKDAWDNKQDSTFLPQYIPYNFVGTVNGDFQAVYKNKDTGSEISGTVHVATINNQPVFGSSNNFDLASTNTTHTQLALTYVQGAVARNGSIFLTTDQSQGLWYVILPSATEAEVTNYGSIVLFYVTNTDIQRSGATMAGIQYAGSSDDTTFKVMGSFAADSAVWFDTSNISIDIVTQYLATNVKMGELNLDTDLHDRIYGERADAVLFKATQTNGTRAYLFTWSDLTAVVSNDKVAVLEVYDTYQDTHDFFTFTQTVVNEALFENFNEGKLTTIVLTEGNNDAIVEMRYRQRDYQPKLTFDAVPTEYSDNPVTSDGIYAALQDKQDVLSAGTGISIVDNVISATGGSSPIAIDSALNASSTNPVANSAITTAINAKADAAALNGYATTATTTALNNALTAHTADTTVHVTASDKANWNAKADAADLNGYATTATTNGINSTLTAHTADTTVHVTAADKTAWNAKADASTTYTKTEVDNIVSSITAVQIWCGTEAQYNAIAVKDPDTLYLIQDA